MFLDKFYTKTDVAKECIKHIPNIKSYNLIVEPSAGSGSFSNQLDCVAYDIMPEGDNIIKQDYLQLQDPFPKNTLVVGNPPFGVRSSLAKAFIKHSIKLGAETIAFILPDTFDKLTNQKVFPDNWRLIVICKLEGTNFTADGEDYYVPCTFYVWTKQEGSLNLRERSVPASNLFTFLPRGDSNADFVINGNNGKVKEVNEVSNPKAEHYIYVNNRERFDDIKNFFATADYNFKSSVNGNNAWIGQQDILKYFYDHFIFK